MEMGKGQSCSFIFGEGTWLVMPMAKARPQVRMTWRPIAWLKSGSAGIASLFPRWKNDWDLICSCNSFWKVQTSSSRSAGREMRKFFPDSNLESSRCCMRVFKHVASLTAQWYAIYKNIFPHYEQINTILPSDRHHVDFPWPVVFLWLCLHRSYNCGMIDLNSGQGLINFVHGKISHNRRQ